jgi:alpha-L-fucosidase
MNVGPTASGRIPDYERAAFAKVGEWIRLHGGDAGPIYQGRPGAIRGEGDDFALELDGALYLFVTGLTATANTMAHGPATRGPGRRHFTGVHRSWEKAVWMDNDEPLKLEFDPAASRLTLHATQYPYGTNTVIRIARLTA